MAYCYTIRCIVKASADIHKVAGLAVASVVCFFLQAFVVLFFDNPNVPAITTFQTTRLLWWSFTWKKLHRRIYASLSSTARMRCLPPPLSNLLHMVSAELSNNQVQVNKGILNGSNALGLEVLGKGPSYGWLQTAWRVRKVYKCNDAKAVKAAKATADSAKIEADNVGHCLLSKMCWKEGMS
jgi:hypothetical protein